MRDLAPSPPTQPAPSDTSPMFELSQIILWVLWNLRPVMALEANLVHVLSEGFALFRDDETLAWMADDPDHAVIVLAGLADAHVKLDLLIYLRACEIAGIPSRARTFTPNRTVTRSGRTPQGCWSSFRRLALRFNDRERLAQRRAERLLSEREASPLRLAATPQSTSPMLRMVEDSAHALEVLHRLRRGRWIARPCAQDGGGVRRDPRSGRIGPGDQFEQRTPEAQAKGRERLRADLPTSQCPKSNHAP